MSSPVLEVADYSGEAGFPSDSVNRAEVKGSPQLKASLGFIGNSRLASATARHRCSKHTQEQEERAQLFQEPLAHSHSD